MELVLRQLSLGLYYFIHLSCKHSPQNYFFRYSVRHVLPSGQVSSFHTHKTRSVIQEECTSWVTLRTRTLSWNTGHGKDSFVVIYFLLTGKIILGHRLCYDDSTGDCGASVRTRNYVTTLDRYVACGRKALRESIKS
jgi:hypothetical protein